jgi:hypothetical protein
MNPTLASRIGRLDLIGVPTDPYGGSSGMAQIGGGAVGSFPGIQLAAGLQGRATAGVLLVTVLIVGGFYIWTRGVQA